MRINIISADSKQKSLGGIEIAPKRLFRELQQQGYDVSLNGKEPVRNYDVHDIHFGFNLRFLRKVKKQSAAVVHAHAQPKDMKGGIFGFSFLKYFIKPYFRFYYNRASTIITPSQYAAECLNEFGVKKPSIHPISNGIPLIEFPAPTETQKKEAHHRLIEKYNLNDQIIGGIGSLFPRKGIVDFIQLAREMPEISFIWVGKSQLLYPWRLFRRKLGKYPDNFQFIGYIDDILDFYYGIDALLFPTHVEMQGIPPLEAAATRCPIIIRDIPVFDWLNHEKNCLKATSISEFKDSIIKILDPEISNPLVEQAAIDVRTHDISKITQEVVKIYQNAIDLPHK